MSTPTPDPSGLSAEHFAGYSRDELVAALIRERNERVSQRRDLVGVKRERNRLRATVEALDLPARDARIREETHQDIARQLETLAADDELISAWVLTCDPPPLMVADWFRAVASKLRAPAVRPVEPSAVPAEGSGLAAMLRAAAAGRREYAGNAPESMRPTLECEAATLDAAATLADGDLEPMYGWLPSWRWSPEMAERLRETGRQVLAVPAEGSGQGPELCPSCGATVWPAGTPWTDSYRRLVLGKSAEGSGQRCPSRIAHESGVVLGCTSFAGHPRMHATPNAAWTDDDDRLIREPAEGFGHPRPFVECLWPVGDDGCVRPTGHDGACRTTRHPRCLCDTGGVQCALSAGHMPPCTPMRPLDTPEGATDA